MKLTQLRISNFQSFGEDPKLLSLAAMSYLLGPNGAGKTAALQALARYMDIWTPPALQERLRFWI